MEIFYITGAKYLFLVSLFLGILWFFKIPNFLKKRVAFFSITTLGLTVIIGKILNHFIYNSRPFVEEGFSPLTEHAPDNGFPSDHMLLVSSIASIVTHYNKRLGALLWFLALLVGISRVMVGVHHLEDILGSMIIAIFSSTVVFWLFKRIRML